MNSYFDSIVFLLVNSLFPSNLRSFAQYCKITFWFKIQIVELFRKDLIG